MEPVAAWLRGTSGARRRGRRRRSEPCGQSGKKTRLRVRVRKPPRPGSLGLPPGAARGQASAVPRVSPSERPAGSERREKMEEKGGSGDGAAGTSGDGGDGGEQLLTVKHELRAGERPRPLPAGPGCPVGAGGCPPAAGGHLGGLGLAGATGQPRGSRVARGASWVVGGRRKFSRSQDARGRGPCSSRSASLAPVSEDASSPLPRTGDTAVTASCLRPKVRLPASEVRGAAVGRHDSLLHPAAALRWSWCGCGVGDHPPPKMLWSLTTPLRLLATLGARKGAGEGRLTGFGD